MKGALATYVNSTSKITMLYNNEIFGRVIYVTRKGTKYYYYYPGIMHEVKHLRLSPGCWFIPEKHIHLLEDFEHLQFTPCDISIPKSKFYTAEEYFREKYSDKEVVNLG